MSQTNRFSIHEEVFEVFPDLAISAVRVSVDLDIIQAGLSELRKEVLSSTVPSLRQFEPITSCPAIAIWRDAYQKMKVKPSKFRSSIESLARRAVRDDPIDTGIDLVDYYNLLSLTLLSPMGGYDTAKLGPRSIDMRFAKPAIDEFQPLGGESASFPLNPNLVVYASGQSIFCWGFNCRDSAEVCLDGETREAIFFTENITATPTVEADAIAVMAEKLSASDVVYFDKSSPTGII